MNVVREIDRINRKQLDLGESASWHDDFKDSAYIYVGGLPYELTEGDVICVFSQYGEILDINMVRDRETGKPKGFCFLKYDDQRSTVLAVDNFNGATLLGRTLRVDHSREYRQKTKKKRRGSNGESQSEEESEVELDEEGKPRVKGFNVAPKGWLDPPVEETSESGEEDLGEGIDLDDPMRDYLIEKRREERSGKKKIKKEDDDEGKRRHKHRHRSRKDGEERHRHRHRHSSHRRIEGGKRDDPWSGHRRRDRDDTFERSRRNDISPQNSRREDVTPERAQRSRDDNTKNSRPGRDDTPDAVHKRLETPEYRPRSEDRYRSRNERKEREHSDRDQNGTP